MYMDAPALEMLVSNGSETAASNVSPKLHHYLRALTSILYFPNGREFEESVSKNKGLALPANASKGVRRSEKPRRAGLGKAYSGLYIGCPISTRPPTTFRLHRPAEFAFFNEVLLIHTPLPLFPPSPTQRPLRTAQHGCPPPTPHPTSMLIRPASRTRCR